MKRNKQAKKKAEELRRLSKGRIVCPKCGKVRKPTRHHILPRRWFGGLPYIIKLCTGCHEQLESVIYTAEQGGRKKLPRNQYWQILKNFLTMAVIAFILYLLIF